jgi:ketosteroid isomerase-like protein
MLDSAPARMPHVMPMTAAVAPQFAARYPEAAIIFDNLHSMHDVISDILANPSVPRNRKRAEIVLAARRYRDDTSSVMTVDAWRTMAQHMGIENMGGPAVGFLPDLPIPTVTYGAVMRHNDRTGEMTGFAYGSAVGGAHAQHAGEVAPADRARRETDPHAGHQMPAAPAERDRPALVSGTEGAAARSDSAQVVQVVREYGDALARGDSLAALRLLTPDAVVLESGRIETVAEYRAQHLPADIGFAAGVPSQRTVQRVHVRGDVAWVASTSASQGEFRGRAVSSAGAELMVLTRTEAGWRISAIHWSSRTRPPR